MIVYHTKHANQPDAVFAFGNIVTIFHALETRKRLNEKLKNAIKPLCPMLMRGGVVSFESESTEA